MNLVGYTATALSRNDIEDTPTNKNVVDFAIVELKDLQGNLVVIYDDAEGANPETQKTCDTNGQVTFYVEPGNYILEINGKAQRINLAANIADYIKLGTGESVQEFADSFALKIFQSPTNGGLTEIQTRTVNANEVYEVRKTYDNSLATIYSDAAGTTEIVQNGTSNVSDSAGAVEFYIADGDYYIEAGVDSSHFNAGNGGDRYTKKFDTLADAVASTTLKEGDATILAGRNTKNDGGGAMWDVVLAGEATENGINVLTNLPTGYKLVLREGGTVNVRSLGALPIVGRDNKAELDKAFEKWHSVYIPRGNYTSSPLKKLTSNVKLSGDGWSNSRIDLKPGELGTLLDTSGVVATITDIRLFGGLTSTQKANEASTAERDGLKWSTQNGSMVQRCKIDGFQRFGVNGGDAANGFWERSTCDNNIIINNWQGVNTGGLAGEYATYTNNEIKSNYFGISIRSGNIIVNNNHIDKNGIGVFFDGTLPNDGHGNFMGNTVNHNTYPIFARDISNGYNCLGNQIFEGIIHIDNCVAFKISAGQINVNKFELTGTGQSYIYSNQMFSSYGNVIERSISNGTLMYDNFFPDGSYLGETTSRSIVIQEVGASVRLNGMTSYPKFRLEATAATSTKFSFEQSNDGVLWDNNNATKDYYWGSSGTPVAKIDAGTGDFEVLRNNGGLVAKSPDGTRYRLTPPNGGGSATWVAA